MQTALEASELCPELDVDGEHRRLSVIVADGSPGYLDIVSALLEFHDIVDLVGRAANWEEVVQLTLSLRPDLVLIDIRMPGVILALAATVMVETEVRIIGMSSTDWIPAHALDFALGVHALVHKERLREEFLTALRALNYPAASGTWLRLEFQETSQTGPLPMLFS